MNMKKNDPFRLIVAVFPYLSLRLFKILTVGDASVSIYCRVSSVLGAHTGKLVGGSTPLALIISVALSEYNFQQKKIISSQMHETKARLLNCLWCWSFDNPNSLTRKYCDLPRTRNVRIRINSLDSSLGCFETNYRASNVVFTQIFF